MNFNRLFFCVCIYQSEALADSRGVQDSSRPSQIPRFRRDDSAMSTVSQQSSHSYNGASVFDDMDFTLTPIPSNATYFSLAGDTSLNALNNGNQYNSSDNGYNS